MLKKNKSFVSSLVLFLSLSLLFTPLLTGCGRESFQEETTWENEYVISEDIIKTAGEADLYLGDLEAYGIEIFVPGGAFEKPMEILLTTPKELPEFDGEKFTPMSSLYSLRFMGDIYRARLPLQVTLSLDKEYLGGIEETGGFYAVHYQEDLGWAYTRPVAIDEEEGLLFFETYHNFFWGGAQLTDDERIEQKSLEISREQWVMSQVDEDIEGLTREIVDEMVMDAFDGDNADIADHIFSEVSTKITRSLNLYFVDSEGDITKVPLGKGLGMIDQIMEGDYNALGLNIATETGKYLNKYLESEALSSEFKRAFNYTGVVAKSLGALSAGDFTGAAEHITEFLMGKNKIMIAARLAIDSVNMRINNWRNSEIEKAYQVFLKGSDGGAYGYNVNEDDFDDLWVQMRAIHQKLEWEALERYADRMGLHVDDIPEEKNREIRDQAKRDLREQFEKRRDQERAIASLKEHNDYLIERLRDWGLLERGIAFPQEMLIEEHVENLFGMVLQVMEDTGRTNVIYDPSYFSLLEEDEIKLEQIMEVIHGYYTGEEKEYKKRLVELGLIKEEDLEEDEVEMAELPDLSGRWEGTMTILSHNLELPAEEETSFQGILGRAIVGHIKRSFDIMVGEPLDLDLEFYYLGGNTYEGTAWGSVPQRVYDKIVKETGDTMEIEMEFDSFQGRVEGNQIKFETPGFGMMPNDFIGYGANSDTIRGTFNIISEGEKFGEGVWECYRVH